MYRLIALNKMNNLVKLALEMIEKNGLVRINLYSCRDYQNPEQFQFKNSLDAIEFIEYHYAMLNDDLSIIKN